MERNAGKREQVKFFMRVLKTGHFFLPFDLKKVLFSFSCTNLALERRMFSDSNKELRVFSYKDLKQILWFYYTRWCLKYYM